MPPRIRRVALTAHITASVGWLGAVFGFLALSVVGLTSRDPQRARAAYLAMESTGWLVLVPLALASLLTGLVQSLGTVWGLFRHYWVLVKFLITIVATVVLVLYMQTLSHLADVAETTPSSGELSGLRDPSPVLHAGAALLLLVVATVLAVHKPQGMTAYGHKHHQGRTRRRPL